MAALPQQQTRPVHAGFPRDCHRRDGWGERLRQRQRRLAQVHWLAEQPPQLQSPAHQMPPLLAEAGIAWLAAQAEVEGETWLH